MDLFEDCLGLQFRVYIPLRVLDFGFNVSWFVIRHCSTDGEPEQPHKSRARPHRSLICVCVCVICNGWM